MSAPSKRRTATRNQCHAMQNLWAKDTDNKKTPNQRMNSVPHLEQRTTLMGPGVDQRIHEKRFHFHIFLYLQFGHVFISFGLKYYTLRIGK